MLLLVGSMATSTSDHLMPQVCMICWGFFSLFRRHQFLGWHRIKKPTLRLVYLVIVYCFPEQLVLYVQLPFLSSPGVGSVGDR